MSKVNLDILNLEITAELIDPRFSSRTHGKRSTARSGCSGPLCKKIMRDIQRERYMRKNPEAQRVRGARNAEIDLYIEVVTRGYHAQLAGASTV